MGIINMIYRYSKGMLAKCRSYIDIALTTIYAKVVHVQIVHILAKVSKAWSASKSEYARLPKGLLYSLFRLPSLL